jgi:2-succinyl-6-hydroxy-2,4-cyclohexadiene-1-carboxylate synthase
MSSPDQNPESHAIRLADGVTYHVRQMGEGAPLLLLHGFTGRGENWQVVAGQLSRAFHLIMVDLLGHGETDAPAKPERYAMAHCADDLIAILDRLGIAQAALAGYSMGGRLALYTALHHQGRFDALVLESASPGLETAEDRAVRVASDMALAARIERDGIAAFVTEWEALALFATQRALPDIIREDQRRIRLRNRPAGLANSLRGMGTGAQPSLWPRLGELRLPVLLIAGQADPKFAALAARMAEHLPNAHLRLLDAGHTVHLEQPEGWADVVANFLRQRAQ